MSKLSFRARALDSSKPMPVYRSEEIPDLPDFAAINRAVPQMPTGMEKEEETEHHLQRALSAQQVYGTAEALVIPVPDIETLSDDYDRLYPSDYRIPKQYIHIQALGMDQEIPDYDMDSDDESWINEQAKKMEITALQFEEMMDRLEKGSGQQATLPIHEAKLLLKEDDDLIMSVYEYWHNKRQGMEKRPLIPQVKSEKRDGTTTNNPYVAFRRRTEKMQTRKNRKNDEASYEKMLKLRRDLNRAVTVLEMIKKREKCKKELLQLTIEILEKRYHMEDFSGQHLVFAESQKATRPTFFPIFDQFKASNKMMDMEAGAGRKPKREYKKRKHKQLTAQQPGDVAQQYTPHSYNDVDVIADLYTSDEEPQSPELSVSDHEDENDPDGPFAFRRKKFCSYHAPLLESPGNWPWSGENKDDSAALKYRFCITSLSRPRPRCIGYARRRLGRGGRVILDRAIMERDAPFWDKEYETRVDHSESWQDAPELRKRLSFHAGAPGLHFRPAGLEQLNASPGRYEGDSAAIAVSSDLPLCGSSGMSNGGDSCSLSIPLLHSQGGQLQEHLVQNIESYFEVHQQELLAMKRQQLEQMAQHESSDDLDSSAVLSSPCLAHSFSSQPSSKFVVDSEKASFAVSALLTPNSIGAHKNNNSQKNGPIFKVAGARQFGAISGGAAAATNAMDSTFHPAAVGNCCNASTPVNVLSLKPSTPTSPVVLKLGITPNESGDSLAMSLVQSELDYREPLHSAAVNSIDAVTSMEVS